MKSLFQYFIQRSFLVNLTSAITILVGVLVLASMKRDLIPPFEWKSISVTVSLPGASPEEVERFLVFPIEEALSGLPGLETMSSTSMSSYAKISLQFSGDHKDISESVLQVESRLNSIKSRLPFTARDFAVTHNKVTSVFLFWFGIEGFNEESLQHRVFVQSLEDELLKIKGVIKSESSLRARDIYIQFVPELLKRYEISPITIRELVRQNFEVASLGTARVDFEDVGVEIARTTRSLEDLRELPLEVNLLGQGLRLKDIAQVDWKKNQEQSRYYINGKPAANIYVEKSVESDLIDLKPEVLAVVSKFNEKAPEGLKVINLVDGPQFVEQQISVLVKNGAIGFLLVILVLMLFLNWRTALMTAIGLPIAYFGTVIVLYSLGISIDLISIIGLILVVGILVDDAIIVSEKYVDLLQQKLAPKAAATLAASKLFLPVTATMLTTLIAFAPMLLIESEISVILKAVPIVVISALALSWLESFFILPNHLAHFVKKAPQGSVDQYFDRLRALFEKVLGQVLRWRYLVLALGLVLLGLGGFIGVKKVKHEFNLNISSERLTLYMILKESDSFDETVLKTEFLSQQLKEIAGDRIENLVFRVGEVWRNGQMYKGPRFAKLDAYLDRNEKYPNRLKGSLQKDVEAFLKDVDRAEFEHLYSEIQMQGGDEDKSETLSVRVEGGEDLDLDQLEASLSKDIISLASLSEYVRDEERWQTSWRFTPNLLALSQYQIDSLSLSAQLRPVFSADEVLETRMAGDRIRIYTDFVGSENLNFQQLSRLEVRSANGSSVPLRFLGNWENTKSLKKIDHIDGERQLVLNFKVNSETANTTVAKADLDKKVEELMAKDPSLKLKVVHGDENQAKNAMWALKVALICILGVLFVMALILNSLTQPLIVGLPIPFGLVGIVFALYLHQLPLGLMALIGLVGTVGVSVNASIVMVDQMNRLGEKLGGVLNRQVIVEGAGSRLRAILLTTLTTLAGMFPMAYSLGGESGFTQPLAFAIAWGLAASTLASLFFLPALLLVREDIFKGFNKLIRRKSDKPIETFEVEFVNPVRPQDKNPWVEKPQEISP